MKRLKLIESLQQDEKSDPDGQVSSMIWCAADVIGQADCNFDEHISKRAANDIIGCVDHGADCSMGISWDTLDVYITEYLDNKEECHECGKPPMAEDRFCSEKCRQDYLKS